MIVCFGRVECPEPELQALPTIGDSIAEAQFNYPLQLRVLGYDILHMLERLMAWVSGLLCWVLILYHSYCKLIS